MPSCAANLRGEFGAAVEDYLRDCEEQGVEPEKPTSGKLMLRVPPAGSAGGPRALVAAQAKGKSKGKGKSKSKSLNQWATEVLQRAVAEG